MKEFESYDFTKTIIETDNNLLYHLFGQDGENQDLIIDSDNISYLENYICDFLNDEDCNYTEEQKQEIKDMLEFINKKLETSQEIQVIQG